MRREAQNPRRATTDTAVATVWKFVQLLKADRVAESWMLLTPEYAQELRSSGVNSRDIVSFLLVPGWDYRPAQQPKGGPIRPGVEYVVMVRDDDKQVPIDLERRSYTIETRHRGGEWLIARLGAEPPPDTTRWWTFEEKPGTDK
jgi:hypothetical protein